LSRVLTRTHAYTYIHTYIHIHIHKHPHIHIHKHPHARMPVHERRLTKKLFAAVQELDLELLKVKFSGSANDADRDEVADIMQKLADIRLQVAEKVSKVNATEGVLIKARSGLEYLWKKLEALELPEGFGEGEDDEEEAGGEEVGGEGKHDGGGGDEESRGGEGSNEESRDDEGEAREGDEAGQAGSQAGGGDDDDGDRSLREAMGSTVPSNLNASIVGDGKTGVIPIMRMCHKKLCAIYSFLEQNTAGVPYRESCPDPLLESSIFSPSHSASWFSFCYSLYSTVPSECNRFFPHHCAISIAPARESHD
jgi:hypothetical protein